MLLKVRAGVMPCTKTGATHYLAQLGLQNKGRGIKGLVVCNSLDVSALGPTIKIWPYVVLRVIYGFEEIIPLQIT